MLHYNEQQLKKQLITYSNNYSLFFCFFFFFKYNGGIIMKDAFIGMCSTYQYRRQCCRWYVYLVVYDIIIRLHLFYWFYSQGRNSTIAARINWIFYSSAHLYIVLRVSRVLVLQSCVLVVSSYYVVLRVSRVHVLYSLACQSCPRMYLPTRGPMEDN